MTLVASERLAAERSTANTILAKPHAVLDVAPYEAARSASDTAIRRAEDSYPNAKPALDEIEQALDATRQDMVGLMHRSMATGRPRSAPRSSPVSWPHNSGLAG